MSSGRKGLPQGLASRELLLIAGSSLLIIVSLVILASFSMQVLSAVRAYVGGEGLYSKAQKEAVYLLAKYAASRAEADFEAFRQAIRVPLGDRRARMELEKPNPDLTIAYQGFIEGNNHPDDVPAMISLFRRFGNFSYMARAMDAWSKADACVERLLGVGNQLHDGIASGTAGPETLDRLLAEAGRIDRELTPLEDDFSRVLGEAARNFRTALLDIMLGGSVLLMAAVITMSRILLKRAVESEGKYRHLVDTASVAIFISELDTGVIVDANERSEEMLGLPGNRLVGTRLELVTSGAPAETWEGFLARAAGGRGVTGNFEMRHADGRMIPVEVSANITEIAGRKVVQSILRDLTERLRAEEALQQADLKYRNIVENAVDGFFQSTPDGRFITVNAAMARILGYNSPEDMVACVRNIERDYYVDPEGRPQFKRMMEERGAVPGFELQAYKKDGAKVWLSESVRAVRDSDGALLYYEGIIEDITARKQLEEQLRQSQKMEAVGRLAGGIAHDFNNLLTVINGYATWLLGRMESDSPYRHELLNIKKAGERAASLTQQLLAFSRKQLLQPKILNLSELVTNFESMLRRLIPENVDLKMALDPSIGLVKADPTQLEQVIMNLVINAGDAMPAGGKLTIETANADLDETYAHDHSEVKPGRYVLLAVSDTGTGMDLATQQRIFEPFFTTKERGKGTGLGLPTVHGIVKQSGGSISVYSVPNMGSTFKFYLPLVEGAAVEELTPAAPASLEGTETILLVEDHDQLRQLAADVLRELGYSVIEARSGEEALRVCEDRSRPVSLMITDLVMPKMNGRDLAERVTRQYPAIKVLFMSGYTENAIVQHGVLDTGWTFIAKPFSPDSLARKVREVLAVPQLPLSILVVDDDAQIRTVLRRILEEAGYQVREASNGREAATSYRDDPADLLITDLVMPEQEGIETINVFRRDFPGVKILAISGAFDASFLEVAKHLGAQAALPKPVSPGTLLATVRRLVG